MFIENFNNIAFILFYFFIRPYCLFMDILDILLMFLRFRKEV